MLSVQEIIQGGGILLISLIIFSESGMFVGFFFPGDTLLLGAGIFAAQGQLDLAILLPAVTLAAILGDNIGYLIGRRYGRPLFANPTNLIFNQKYLHQAEAFFWKHGSKAMLVTHFVPIVRTFAPAAAGMSQMDHKKFILFDAIGVMAWAIGITLVGYFFGSKVPHIDKYIHYVLIAVILASILPAAYHLTKALQEKKKTKKHLADIMEGEEGEVKSPK